MVVASQEQFELKLAEGQEGENRVLRFMFRNGYIIAPLSKIEDFKDKGPRLYLPNGELLIVPDLLCMRLRSMVGIPGLPDEFWLEVKKKNKASYYRINHAWQSGIDKRYWTKYLRVQDLTEKPVLISHLVYSTSQEDMDKQGVPSNKRPAPTGLYLHPVTMTLAFDPNPNPRMVYWKLDDMQKVTDFKKKVQVCPN